MTSDATPEPITGGVPQAGSETTAPQWQQPSQHEPAPALQQDGLPQTPQQPGTQQPGTQQPSMQQPAPQALGHPSPQWQQPTAQWQQPAPQWQPPAAQWQQPAGPIPGRNSYGFAIASFVIGIASIISGWTIVAPVVGVVLGAIALRRNTKERTLALWGVWLNGVILGLAALGIVLLLGLASFGLFAGAFVA